MNVRRWWDRASGRMGSVTAKLEGPRRGPAPYKIKVQENRDSAGFGTFRYFKYRYLVAEPSGKPVVVGYAMSYKGAWAKAEHAIKKLHKRQRF